MKTIYLDPGHGGKDAGAVNGTRRESADNLRLALAVRDFLEQRGQTVLLCRTEDIYVPLAQRTDQANRAGADLFVSLHRNAFTNSSANGVEVLIHTGAGRIEEAAAVAVLEELAEAGIQSNRGIKQQNFHVLRESAMPAMMVELGFISNMEDNRLFDTQFRAYTEAIAHGILSALGEPWDRKESAPVQYRVQVGAFHQEHNARQFLQVVQDMGLQAFLTTSEQVEQAASSSSDIERAYSHLRLPNRC